uniref:Uncharacterized protein n=1 Tax=Sphaerodactylus townsendi TaxID=933632 RepID=A0ACB8FD83_9SAUR
MARESGSAAAAGSKYLIAGFREWASERGSESRSKWISGELWMLLSPPISLLPKLLRFGLTKSSGSLISSQVLQCPQSFPHIPALENGPDDG